MLQNDEIMKWHFKAAKKKKNSIKAWKSIQSWQ